ncbi:MAG: TetR/AcrR family transcriptional regulator [Alphaproteobacteria bacterium]|nr:TetR/AcrR family transcriptional regulator [Alphaproteobacteria bacterium]MCB9928712.1 TetR/AcrR family transcriptional regulator [Alphaproteobacteria bacterium]
MSPDSRHDLVTAQVENPDLVDRRRGQIIAAAIKLFGARGYYTVTIKDIAQEAGISPGLIYQYFRNKEDVLLLTLLERLDQYHREVAAAAAREPEPLARLYAAFAAYCGVVDANKEATILAYRSFRSLDPERRKPVLRREREIHALLAGCVRACQERGLVRALDVDLVCSQLASMAHAWALQSWRFDRSHDVHAYVRASFDLLAHGLLTPAGATAAADLGPF